MIDHVFYVTPNDSSTWGEKDSMNLSGDKDDIDDWCKYYEKVLGLKPERGQL